MTGGRIVSVAEFMTDPGLLGSVFSDRETWFNWLVFAKACFGEHLTPRELEVYRKFTQRSSYPGKPFSEVWLCTGRRGGKSRVLSALAVYLAFCIDWRPYLSIGERAYIPIVAADRMQARVIFNYMKDVIWSHPTMREFVVRDTQFEFELKNGVDVAIMTASYRTIRGRTVVAACFDEIAFWKDESSSNPDEEIVKAIRPSMATVPNSMLFCASSPWRQRGVLWKMFCQYYGKDDDSVLFWKAPSWEMNPTLDKGFLERERKRDPISFRTEYEAEFRSDAEGLFTEEALDAVIDFGVQRREPRDGVTYRAFVDASGLSSDSFVVAVAHEDEDGTVVVDEVKEYAPRVTESGSWSPVDPNAVVADVVEILRKYRVFEVTGDRYGGNIYRNLFAEHGIHYTPTQFSKTDIYRMFLAMVNTKRVRLPDNGVLRSQLLSLERRTTGRGLNEVIDHPRGMHDDVANAVAGVCTLMHLRQPEVYIGFAGPDDGGVEEW